MFAKISECPLCGAPIWAPGVWGGITPPPSTFSCSCVPQPTVVTTTNTTMLNGQPANNGWLTSQALNALAKAFESEGVLQPDPPTIESLSAKVEKLEGMLNQVLQAAKDKKETKKVKKQKLLKD